MEPEEGAVAAMVEPEEDTRGHPGSATATIVDNDCK